MKEKNITFSAGLVTGILFSVLMWTVFFQSPSKIQIPDKMSECLEQRGSFSLHDYSWKEDGSEYKMRCVLPQRELFFIDIN